MFEVYSRGAGRRITIIVLMVTMMGLRSEVRSKLDSTSAYVG